MNPLTWLNLFLPKLRCPKSGEALREATVAEKVRCGIPADKPALASQSGTYVYPVIDGIPHLLPSSAQCPPSDA